MKMFFIKVVSIAAILFCFHSANSQIEIATGITGSGTINFVPKFLTPISLTNSLLIDDGTNMGIGTLTPTERFQITNGNLYLSNGVLGIQAGVNGNYSISTGNKVQFGGSVEVPNVINTRIFFTGTSNGFTLSGTGNFSELTHNFNAHVFQDNNMVEIARFMTSSANPRVGIGTAVPSEALHVVGAIRMVDGNEGNGKLLTSDANGVGSWQAAGIIPHVVSTPTTAATVTLTVNAYNAINPAGTIAALTVNFPNSPADGDFIELKFTQIVTAVTYVAGTGGATIKGQINGVVGSYVKWVYDTGTNTWY